VIEHPWQDGAVVELIEIGPGRFRVKRKQQPVARSRLPMPSVISDIMPPTEQVDGKFYTSKAAFRATGRALGLTEVGNEKTKPKTRATAAHPVKQQRRDAIRKAVARYRAGERSRRR
jgi:hypothetical protein